MPHALVAAMVLSALTVPTAASAEADYPSAGNTDKRAPARAKGQPRTFTVCKTRRCRYRTIGAAVRKARGGDTIRVRRGTYRENVVISGPRYEGLKLVGSPKRPRAVKLDGRSLRGARAQNAVLINNADNVTVNGVYARNFKANGFFVVNVDGYRLTNLVAGRTGVYGLYAFNSKGGTMSRSEAFANNDAGFYIGQTPKQSKPKRSIVSRVKSYNNVLGFSGTNMRYVTIKNSQWFNNGAGIVPNALESEKFPPPQQNVISGNEIFWNNFNYYRGAPFRIPKSGPAGFAGYPIGVGVLLFGSQQTTIARNRIFGNWLVGYGAIEQVVLKSKRSPALREAAVLRDNVVRDNRFGLGGADLNGRDMFYDGSGTGNCFARNALRSPNMPASDSVFATCPKTGMNAFDAAAQLEAISWVPQGRKRPRSAETHWIEHPHKKRKGIRPLTRYRR